MKYNAYDESASIFVNTFNFFVKNQDKRVSWLIYYLKIFLQLKTAITVVNRLHFYFWNKP